MSDIEKQIDDMIENEIDTAIEQRRAAQAIRELRPQYNFDEEMENAEDPCCDECRYWDAFALKHGYNRPQMDKIRREQVGNLSTDCRVYKDLAEEVRQKLLKQCE